MKRLLFTFLLFISALLRAQSSITVISPNGGEHIQQGKSTTISWSFSGIINNVRIEYSIDGGTNWTQIASSAPSANSGPNSGNYSWTVPIGSTTDQARIRISDAVAPSVYDISNSDFSIINLDLLTPNGSEHLQAGKIYNITWTNSTNLSSVDIKYTTDDGGSWGDVVAGYNASFHTYSWSVPSNIGSDRCKIKISDAANALVSDISQNDFSIMDVDLVNPANSSRIQAGLVYDITWTNTTNLVNVKLEYSTDNGASWSVISSSVSASPGLYHWTVPPGIGSDQCKIRISDAAASVSVNDMNTGAFSIIGLTLTSPVGGEYLHGNNPYTFTWNCSSNLSNVDIAYTTNNGVSWFPLATGVNASSHSYTMTIPPDISSDQCKLKISDALSPAISGISPNVFSVRQLSLTLPNGGEYVKAGSSCNITWTRSINVTNVSLEYSTNNGSSWTTIVSPLDASLGTYAWNVPGNLATDQAIIRISDTQAPSQVKDVSDASFHIANLEITSPNGGEHIQAGTAFNITWTNSSNITSVDLSYSLDGTNWTGIQTGVNTSQGSFTWNVPANIFSDQCKIKIKGVSPASSIEDISSNSFSIVSFSIVSPNGNEQLQAGKPYNIRWSSSSNISNVKLEYTTNNGTSWNLIASSVTASLSSYTWNVPNTPSTGCRVKISEVTNPANYVISGAVFTISSIAVSAPNGNESFLDGSIMHISWTSQNINNIRIDYSLNGGASFSPIVASTPASSGSYDWTIPAGLSSANCIIQISDAANINLKDQSDNAFIISNLSLTSPTLGVVWQSGTAHNITWTSSNINNVKLEYSWDNGSSWNTITGSTPASSGQYAWTIPNTPNARTLTQCLVRISDQSFPANLKQSSTFTVTPIPAIQVTSPNGFENWQENSQHNITWTATDNISNVKVEYTTNGGSTWNTVTNSVAANAGTYPWTLPSGTSSAQCYIKISNTANQAVNDQSDNPFVISLLRLTSPSLGSERWQQGKTYNITWTSQNIGNVKLEYSIDNKASWLPINTTAIQADLGTYSWTVPNNTASTNCFVRISDAAHSEITNINSSAFTIVSLAITSPNGGENWLAGSQHAVTWSSSNINSIKLEYSSDNGSSWQTITNSTLASAGSLTWTVPGTSSNTYKMRISDASDQTINDQSDNTFVVSLLNLTSPVGGEVWKVGTQQNITWTSSNTISNVKIEYTTNNGNQWIEIASSVTSGSSPYRWIVPNTTSPNCKVRVSSVANPEVYSISQAFFTIDKNVIVQAPNGGESWEIGSTHNITWQSDPSVLNVRIDYSTDNGITWKPIKSPVDASLHSYSWQVPNTPSPNCIVKITDVDNSTNFDVSDNKFSITSTPFITVTRPNGGEIFETGAQEVINWTSNLVNFVRIEYSLNNGATWNLIQSAVASTGSYTWNVPNVKSSQCRIRITDENNSLNTDISDDKFTINPRIIVTAPNGGESIPVASSYTIAWTSTNVANVKIDYSTDNGSSWTNVTTSTPAAAGTYSWVVPNAPSSNCLVRVSDAVKTEIFDQSDNLFSITSKIFLTSPNGAESWQSGSQHDITWSCNNVANVALSYSTNNGVTWTQITASTPASSGSYRWSIPSNVQTTQCKVKVSDASNLNVFDISDNVFTISSLLLKTPNGTENYAISSMQTVTWTSSNISYVKLEYSINNGIDWSEVATSLPSSGIYYWEIPNTPSAQCLFRISDANNPGTYDLSDNIFAITESPTITMLYPVGNEIFRIGSTETLKWKSNNVTNVKIEYSVNNGSDWKTIALSTPSTGTYSWVVPQENSNLCKIRVSDASRPAINAMSTLPFTITNSPKITVIAPNGSENYPTGSIQTISWSSSNVSKVKIEYSINNGIDWSAVAASYPSSGVYSWTVPNTPSTQCKIRISDTSNVGTYDISDNNFLISEAPSITVLYPNGKEKFATGTKETIKWKSNNVNNVKIEYSINNGSDWNLIVSSIASTGTYTWLVPNVSSNLCKVRISDVTKADVFDASDSLFSIANTPKITITAPNGDESYQVGSNQTLKWTSSGISNVKIEYSINNGIDWYLIEASYPSAGIYSWAVPNTPSTQCLIKVTDITNPLNYDISDKVFTIAASPVLQVTAPNGNETWEIGKTQYITWNSVNIVNAKIEYSINNGSDWTVIIASTKSTGSYSWIVPNTPSYQCRVKISDAANPATYDISDSIFTIAASPKIVVTSPNGSESIKAGSLKNITWTSNNVANVKIEYSVNNGVNWNTIAESVPSTGLNRWTVPDTSSLQCRIKISDASNSNVVDISDNVFTISKIAILTPSSGETLLAGTQYQISWASECINNVKLEYSTDKGTSWTSIVASTSALAGSYQWNIPQTAIKQCMLRISDVANASVSDISDNYFSVQTLVLLSPSEKMKLTVGSMQPIQWKYYNVTNIKIEYSADGGIAWSTIVSSTPAKNGAYNWKVPNNPSEFCLVRITDLSNTQSIDITKSYFAITNVDAVERVDNSVPTDYALLQNHPNPFNPTTMIRFRIPVSTFVTLKVYDLMGKEICTLVNEEKSAGTYDVNFNAALLANGIYLYKIQAGSYVATKKLLLLK